MKRTSITLSDDLHYMLRHEAARRQITITELVREALEAHLGVGKKRRFFSAKAGRSGYDDTARRLEELLGEGFGR